MATKSQMHRKDIDYTDGRRPDKQNFGATLSEDMKRRDFTMNAIALILYPSG